jgi:hypothetical protein
MSEQQPTPEGLRRYPDTAGYYVVPEGFFAPVEGETEAERYACTCTQVCAPYCEGGCGCSACDMRAVVYNDMGQTYPHVLAEKDDSGQ